MSTSNSSRLDRSNLLSLSDKELDHFAYVANKAADAAGEIIRKYFGKKLKVVEKNGDGPVTIADKEAEEAIILMIFENFPSHVVFGEETKWNSYINGKVEKSSSPPAVVPDFVWFLDPIDGTMSFIAGIQALSFGTLIALLYKGKPILGIIDQPILRVRWMGITGRRTTKNGEGVSTSACEELGCAYASLKAPDYNYNAEYAFNRTVYTVGHAFFDGNCIACGELASGVLHVVVDCALDPEDFLALIPIVEGAGGVITNWQGGELCLEGSAADYVRLVPEGGYKFVAAGDKRIHQEVINELSKHLWVGTKFRDSLMSTSNSSRLDRSNLLSLSDKELDHFAYVANKAADAAGEIIRMYFGKKLNVVEKNGDDPVTIADKEAEEAIISIIFENFPSHVVFGEETKWNSYINGKVEKSSSPPAVVPDFVWFLDPIDGTASFIAGKQAPSFGTMIALLYKGKPILGIIDQPISRVRWMGIMGRRTTKNGEGVSTSACEELGCAFASLKAPHHSDNAEYAFKRIVYKVRNAFLDGNPIACGELSSGVLHVVVDCALDPKDFLALIPIVEGAGGVITNWQGGELCLEGSAADYVHLVPKKSYKFVAAGDERIHQEVIKELLKHW